MLRRVCICCYEYQELGYHEMLIIISGKNSQIRLQSFSTPMLSSCMLCHNTNSSDILADDSGPIYKHRYVNTTPCFESGRARLSEKSRAKHRLIHGFEHPCQRLSADSQLLSIKLCDHHQTISNHSLSMKRS